jgi:hypothetical protein
VSPVEQDTFFYKKGIMQLFTMEATLFKKKCPWKHKKTTSKVAYFTIQSFSVLPTDPKSAQITYSFP